MLGTWTPVFNAYFIGKKMPVFLIVYGRLSWRMWDKIKHYWCVLSWPEMCLQSEEFRPSLLLFRLHLVIMINCPEYPSAQHGIDWVDQEGQATQGLENLGRPSRISAPRSPGGSEGKQLRTVRDTAIGMYSSRVGSSSCKVTLRRL